MTGDEKREVAGCACKADGREILIEICLRGTGTGKLVPQLGGKRAARRARLARAGFQLETHTVGTVCRAQPQIEDMTFGSPGGIGINAVVAREGTGANERW